MAKPERDAAAEDAQFLRSGVLLNMLGYLFRIALPALSVFVIRVYGPRLFGVFVVAQLSLQLVFRVGSLGLDRAALWWIAKQEGDERGADLFAMYFWVTLSSVVLALAIGFPAAGLIARWSGDEGAKVVLRSMAAGLVPMALLEMSVHASMGTRDMAIRVFVRDVAVPTLQLSGGLAMGLLGYKSVGLPLAYLLALTVGAAVATFRVRHLIGRPRVFVRSPAGALRLGDFWRVPRPVVQYAIPIWLSELANSVVSRLDVYVIAQFMNAQAVGVYAAITQVANALRAIRQSFDPVVLALCSKIDRQAEPERIRTGFTRATVAVMLIQFPMWAALVCFDKYLFMLLGSAFEGGQHALWILSTCWLINGIIGLHGVLLLGWGRSDLILYNVGFTLLSQAGLLYWFTPRWGVTGAALAVCLSYVCSNLLQWLQARMVSGTGTYGREMGRALGVATAALAAMGGVLFVLKAALPDVDDLARSAASFGLFLLVGGIGYTSWLRPSTRPPEPSGS